MLCHLYDFHNAKNDLVELVESLEIQVQDNLCTKYMLENTEVNKIV
jgi:hypothetical protein